MAVRFSFVNTPTPVFYLHRENVTFCQKWWWWQWVCEIVLWNWTTSLQLHYKNMIRWQVMVMDGDDKMIMMKMVMLVYVNACDDCNDCNSNGECKKRRMGPLSFHSLIWRIPHTHQLRDVSHLKQLRWELMPRTIRRNPSPLLYICFWSMVQLYC